MEVCRYFCNKNLKQYYKPGSYKDSYRKGRNELR